VNSLIDDQFDEFLIFLTNELLNDQINTNIRKLIEDILEITLLSKGIKKFLLNLLLLKIIKSLLANHSLIFAVSLSTKKIKLDILSHFSKAIVTFAHSYYIVTGDSVISNDSVVSVLRIFTKLCEDVQFMEILLESDLLSISWAIFELTFVKAHEGSESEIIKDIESLVQSCWSRISNSCRVNHKEDAVFGHISKQIKESLLNIQYAVR